VWSSAVGTGDAAASTTKLFLS